MKQLIIIGARGMGRELFFLAQECRGFGTDFIIKGFLDDKTDALEELGAYPQILGPVESYEVQPHDVFVCALGDVLWKKHYIDIIHAKNGTFHSLIHRSAVVGPNSNVGTGCIISRYAIITVNASIGDYTFVGSFSTIGHDAIVGQYCHLAAYSFMGGYSALEDLVTLHPRCNILPRVRIAEKSVVGAGSVVLRSVRAQSTVFGVPARKIKAF